MAAADDAKRMRDPAFWRRICDLDLSDVPPGAGLPVDGGQASQFADDLRVEGWAQHGPLVPRPTLARLRSGVEALKRARLPPVFLWVYREPWDLVARLDPLFRVAMGDEYRVLPCFWTWFVPVGADKSGWPVHRDRTKGPVNVHPDGSPMTLSVWIPITRATPHNGCMYVVPAPYAPPTSREIQLGDVRALPAEPGEILAWRQDVWHWGGRSSARAEEPRVSLGIELQGRTSLAFDEPLLAPGTIPPLEHRLAFVGGNLWRYRRRLQNPAIPGLAKALVAAEPGLRQSLLGVEKTVGLSQV